VQHSFINILAVK